MTQKSAGRHPKTGALTDARRASALIDGALQKRNKAAFLLAVRKVAEDHGMSALARRAGLSRESLYKMFAADGNPQIDSLWSVLKALGLQFCVSPSRKN